MSFKIASDSNAHQVAVLFSNASAISEPSGSAAGESIGGAGVLVINSTTLPGLEDSD